MATVYDQIELNAPPERVWAMITALRYLQLWFADVAAVEAISTPHTAAGTRFELRRANGHAREPWMVAEATPLQHLRFSSMRADVHWIFTLESAGQRTRLTLEYRWRTRGIERFLPHGAQQRLVRNSLTRLNELIVFNRDIALLHGVGDE